MRVVVRSTGITLDEALRNQVDRRVGSAFGRFGPRVERVTVRIGLETDSAVPGVRCAVTLTLADGAIKVQDSGDDPFEAVARAVDRAGRALDREVDHQQALF